MKLFETSGRFKLDNGDYTCSFNQQGAIIGSNSHSYSHIRDVRRILERFFRPCYFKSGQVSVEFKIKNFGIVGAYVTMYPEEGEGTTFVFRKDTGVLAFLAIPRHGVVYTNPAGFQRVGPATNLYFNSARRVVLTNPRFEFWIERQNPRPVDRYLELEIRRSHARSIRPAVIDPYANISEGRGVTWDRLPPC